MGVSRWAWPDQLQCNQQHYGAVVAAVHLRANEGVTDVLHELIGYHKVVQTPKSEEAHEQIVNIYYSTSDHEIRGDTLYEWANIFS